MYPAFHQHINAMNVVYQLEKPGADIVAINNRLAQFQKILLDEVSEISDVQLEASHATNSDDILRVRTGLADLLGDIIVYCASEANRWDIPLASVLAIIMSSNFSKLDVDGTPIKNPVTDKFEKGPNYWKPEPLIGAVLHGYTKVDMRGFSEPNEISDLQNGGMKKLLRGSIASVDSSQKDRQPESQQQEQVHHQKPESDSGNR